MKINSRRLNKGERFCCFQRDVRDVFVNCDINIYFAYFHRNYEYEGQSKSVKYQGKIIAKLIINNRDIKPDFFPDSAWASLYFYVLKEDEFSENLHKEFILFLPKIRAIFDKYNKKNPDSTSGYYIVDVELLDNTIYLHERVERC